MGNKNEYVTTGIALARPYVASTDRQRTRITAEHPCSACGESGNWVTGDKGPLKTVGALEYHRAAAKCKCGFLNFFYVVVDKENVDIADALAQMAEAGDIPPAELECAIDASRAWVHGENWEEALAACNRAVTIDDQSAAAWFNLAWVHCCLGNFEEARDFYLKVTELPEDFPSVWRNLAVAYDGLGQLELALDAINTFLERFPSDRSALELKNNYLRALNESDDQSNDGKVIH